MNIRSILLLLAALAPTSALADATVSSVAELQKAVARARAGETITLAAGRYDVADLKIPRDLTLKGEGEVVLYSSRPVEKGLLNPLPGASLRVENMSFIGARSPDDNGAGIRHDGHDLTIVNCRFEDDEDGVLATGDEKGSIRIEDSEFIRNGHGDGYSHGIYVSSGALLDIRRSRFVGTRIGHHVKSLARETYIRESVLDDADGRTSYDVDASRGGAVVIESNLIIQSADSDNYAIFNYDLSRGGEAAGLTIRNNRIVNRCPKGILLRNGSGLAPVIENNVIVNEDGGRLD